MAKVKCLHSHGTEVRKPIPSYQLFKGTVFDQVDQAVDFVLSKVNRRVTPSDKSPASNVEYEIPYKVVREAIVNAVAHRDYSSNTEYQSITTATRKTATRHLEDLVRKGILDLKGTKRGAHYVVSRRRKMGQE